MIETSLPPSLRLAGRVVVHNLPARAHALALDLALAAMTARHPTVFGRLQSLDGASIKFRILDLAVSLTMRLGATPSLRLTAADEPADATVSGELPALLALLEGRADADSLFFTRDISIQGDTGLVVALRNAIDDSEIDLVSDLCAPAGPLAPIARRVVHRAIKDVLRLGRGLDMLRSALFPDAVGT